ncbi:MAG: hypothetical protein Q9207_008007, partial [Kuettlingeria erythrocarpa]
MGLFMRISGLLGQVLILLLRAAAASDNLPALLGSNATQFAVYSLPNVTFPLSPSWAGQIPIPGASDDKLFFWLFQGESHNASQNLIKTQIPYFAHAVLSGRSILPLNLKAIALGDAVFGNGAAVSDVVTTTYLHQQASYYGIPEPILSAFDAADRQCGFDRVLSQLTYPPKGSISIPGNPEGLNFLRRKRELPANKKAKTKRQQPCPDDGKAPDTPALINASVNAACFLGCATFSTALAYLNSTHGCFNPYNVHYTCQERLEDYDSASWLNQPGVKKAIHALQKEYQECNETILETTELPEPPAYEVLPELLAKGVKVHVYSGDWDLLLNHWGTELVLQNMT